MEKKTYHHGNLRAALVKAAAELIAEAGLDGLTLRAVAERIGVSRSAMYRHFSNKEQLLAMVVIDGFERLVAATEPHLFTHDAQSPMEQCPLQRFKLMGLGYVDFAVNNLAIYELMFRKDSSADLAEVRAAGEASFAVLTGMIEQCKAAGVVKAGETGRQAFTAWAALHGTISLCKDQPPYVVPDATLANGYLMVLETLMDGMATEADWRERDPQWRSLAL